MDMILQALQVMAFGMLGIFVVMGIIILTIRMLSLVKTKEVQAED